MMMETWLEWAKIILPMVVLVLQLFMGWVLWSLVQKFMTRQDCKACRDEYEIELEASKNRLISLEESRAVGVALEDLRVKDEDLEKIYDRVNIIDAKVNAQGGTLTAISRGLDLINEHLISGGNRN